MGRRPYTGKTVAIGSLQRFPGLVQDDLARMRNPAGARPPPGDGRRHVAGAASGGASSAVKACTTSSIGRGRPSDGDLLPPKTDPLYPLRARAHGCLDGQSPKAFRLYEVKPSRDSEKEPKGDCPVHRVVTKVRRLARSGPSPERVAK